MTDKEYKQIIKEAKLELKQWMKDKKKQRMSFANTKRMIQRATRADQ